jgi:hypothetical protein
LNRKKRSVKEREKEEDRREGKKEKKIIIKFLKSIIGYRNKF